MPTNLNAASHQWATRPDDQRFLTLEDLKQALADRRSRSSSFVFPSDRLRMKASEGLSVETFDPVRGETVLLEPTHWSFGQMAAQAQAPAQYLRRLPPELAAINLQWGLEQDAARDDTLILATEHRAPDVSGETTGVLRAMNSVKYGRIWDQQVVEAVERVNHDGRWQVPAASYARTDPKRATTLYASDRDVFIFLVDAGNPVEVGGETLFRGFYTWNSEVGAATFGLTTFLYRYICDNRIIWGAADVRELSIRHNVHALERFYEEGSRWLSEFADASSNSMMTAISAAQRFEIPRGEKEGAGWDVWLQARGFNPKQAKAAVESAIREEGQARSLWDIIQGITASARSIVHADTRVEVEKAAGKLLDVVA